MGELDTGCNSPPEKSMFGMGPEGMNEGYTRGRLNPRNIEGERSELREGHKT
jgi:hypothetical protein